MAQTKQIWEFTPPFTPTSYEAKREAFRKREINLLGATDDFKAEGTAAREQFWQGEITVDEMFGNEAGMLTRDDWETRPKTNERVWEQTLSTCPACAADNEQLMENVMTEVGSRSFPGMKTKLEANVGTFGLPLQACMAVKPMGEKYQEITEVSLTGICQCGNVVPFIPPRVCKPKATLEMKEKFFIMPSKSTTEKEKIQLRAQAIRTLGNKMLRTLKWQLPGLCKTQKNCFPEIVGDWFDHKARMETDLGTGFETITLEAKLSYICFDVEGAVIIPDPFAKVKIFQIYPEVLKLLPNPVKPKGSLGNDRLLGPY